MIERETVVPAERRLVGAVIYNRLEREMPLGIDATLRYGLGIPGTRPLTQEHLRSSSPTTRVASRACLPRRSAIPLPSLRAAAAPAGVDYLYYLRRPNSVSHFFRPTLRVLRQGRRGTAAADDRSSSRAVTRPTACWSTRPNGSGDDGAELRLVSRAPPRTRPRPPDRTASRRSGGAPRPPPRP